MIRKFINLVWPSFLAYKLPSLVAAGIPYYLARRYSCYRLCLSKNLPYLICYKESTAMATLAATSIRLSVCSAFFVFY